jgi:hypothetical protein
MFHGQLLLRQSGKYALAISVCDNRSSTAKRASFQKKGQIMTMLSAPIEVICRRERCKKSFPLDIPTLEFTHPTSSPACFKPVAISCPHCGRVSTYESGNRPLLLPQGLRRIRVRTVMLECECGGILPVFTFAETSDWTAEASRLTFGKSARCSNGGPFLYRRVIEVSEPE